MLTKPWAASLKSSGFPAEAVALVYLFLTDVVFLLLEWKGLSHFLQPCYCALFQEPVDSSMLGKLTHQFQLWRKGLVSLLVVLMQLLRSLYEWMASFHIYLCTGYACREQKSAAASLSHRCITVSILIEFVSCNLDHLKWWGKGRGSEIWAGWKKGKKAKVRVLLFGSARAPCRSLSV